MIKLSYDAHFGATGKKEKVFHSFGLQFGDLIISHPQVSSNIQYNKLKILKNIQDI